MKKAIYKTSFGNMMVVEKKGKIDIIDFTQEEVNTLDATTLTNDVALQLEEYFMGRRKTFDFPMKLEGTEFQQKVWQALREIPYGQTRSYSDIAKMIGKDKATRAVGMANNKNKLIIVIPCHRVIGKNKSLTGYRGGLVRKRRLLDLEELNS